MNEKEDKRKKYIIGVGFIAIIISAGLIAFHIYYSPATKPPVIPPAIEFVFNCTRIPSKSYNGSTDTRELAALFDYIDFLSSNSTIIRSIGFDLGDEIYLGSGWFGLENCCDSGSEYHNMSAAWCGNNSVPVLDVPEEAAFLKFRACSVGRTNYQDLAAGFKELLSYPTNMNENLFEWNIG